MISLKHKKKEVRERNNGRPSMSLLRLQKDLNELDLPPTCTTSFANPDDLMNFKLIICPDEGFYAKGEFIFKFCIGPEYPNSPPKVKCETLIYHPNIDLQGNVCLNILREDWNPVLSINSIVCGLQFLLLEPNAEDALNEEAADALRKSRDLFRFNVAKAMRGNFIGETYYPQCLKK